MDESRLQRLENQVGDLRERAGRNDEAIEHLTDNVGKLSDNVAELTAALNRGRGALWAISSGAAVLGAAGSWAASKLFGA
jgi:ABC-type transporter Mla subunit MlaD